MNHPYSPSVINCPVHGMGDCPYHAGGPCTFREEPDDPPCARPADDDQHLPEGLYDVTGLTAYPITVLSTLREVRTMIVKSSTSGDRRGPGDACTIIDRYAAGVRRAWPPLPEQP